MAPDQAAALRALRAAQREYQRASAALERSQQARDDAVRAAIAAGASHSTIAAEIDLTRGRVGQIALRRR